VQIRITHDDPNKPTEIITVMAPAGDNGWKYTDIDGDRIAVFTANIEGTPGVYFRTDPNGAAIPLADLEAFIAAVRETAQRSAENSTEGIATAGTGAPMPQEG
jgi:hypothetical protein